MMHNNGTRINHKRVERIWREEGLKLPKKQVKKRRIYKDFPQCLQFVPTAPAPIILLLHLRMIRKLWVCTAEFDGYKSNRWVHLNINLVASCRFRVYPARISREYQNTHRCISCNHYIGS
ncbi:MAG: hypothetical protein IH607_07535 [Firmicutes bacterium]|nr:hypothetical protein [Bacillota bacterium]